MTTTTSQVHSEAVSDWSPIGPLVSGMGGSVAFTILTGLAERPVFPLPSAFRTGYGPRCLSAQGQSCDLQHLSPMLTRCGNSALRDMAHVIICPIDPAKLHGFAPFLKQTVFPNSCVLILCRSQRDSLMTSRVQKRCQGRTSFLNQSSRVERRAFPRQVRQSIRASVLLAPAPCRGGLVQY